jgi:cellulose synthase/poly-beta-1,6-N-acetylglucosamine synthase-like glycosyltransferase
MYAEDLDLCWRLERAGYVTRYEPRGRQDWAAATAAAFGDQMTARFMNATYSMLARRRGFLRAWVTAAINVAGAAARLAWTAPWRN